MTEKRYPSVIKSRRLPVAVLALLGGLLAGLALGWLIAGRLAATDDISQEPTPEATAVAMAQPNPTAVLTCADQFVNQRLDATLAALEMGESVKARSELDAALSAYVDLLGDPACDALAHELLALQSLVAAAEAWASAAKSNSIRQVEVASDLIAQALDLARDERIADAANTLAAEIDSQRDHLLQASDPGRVVTEPQTLATELVGGLFPLCEVNALVKPFLFEETGSPSARVTRMEIVSGTLFVLAGGQLMSAELDQVLGPAPTVFLQATETELAVVAGAEVGELVDLTPTVEGDLLLLEKSGRLLRRSQAGEWSLERQARLGELLVAVAPYATRSYLLDPESNQIWRFEAGADAESYAQEYFAEEAIRSVRPGTDMAIDGSIYVSRSDGRVRRYYVGVEDPNFQPDTALGTPAAIFLADDPESTLVYVVDSVGRRVLGLDRENGAYRLGFTIHLDDVQPLTSGAISNGRVFITDGDTLFAGIMSPEPVSTADCPARPFPRRLHWTSQIC